MEDDDGGFAVFIAAEHPRLVGALSLYVGDVDLAEELAGEALTRAAQRWPRVRDMAAPGAWVHRVAMNLARSRWRRRAAERRARSRLQADRGVHHDADPADRVAVRQAVAGLPERQRGVVVLRYFHGMDVAGTAAALGISEQAVAAATYRAVATLRRRLGLNETAPAGEATDGR